MVLTATADKVPAKTEVLGRPHFRPDIEGLRALGVFFVVAYHAGIPGFGGGYSGVDVFFVVSGYLITWLLVDEIKRTGSISLSNFYARRSRRLLPASGLMLVATVILGVLVYGPSEQDNFALTTLSSATYSSNLFFAKTATNYLGAPPETNALLHTWSLSVEEQFYLVWPWLLLLGAGVLAKTGGRLRRRRLIAVLVLATAASFAASLYLTAHRQAWAFFLSPARAWEFAVGALVVFIPYRRDTGGLWMRTLGAGLGLAAFGGLAASLLVLDDTTSFPGTAALLPVMATAAALYVGQSFKTSMLVRVLATRPFQEIGRLSYSWYLWHWPALVFGLAILGPLGLPARIGLMALALLIAELSYRVVERPIRENKRLIARPRTALLMALFVTVAGSALALGWWQFSNYWQESPRYSQYAFIAEDLPAINKLHCENKLGDCIFGDPAGVETVVLFGDSHAGQWFPAVDEMAKQRNWRVLPFVMPSCPAVDYPYFNKRFRKVYTECDAWRSNAIEKIREVKPALVFVSSSDVYPFTHTELVTGTTRVFEALSTAARKVIIIRDTPRPGFDVPRCLERRSWRPDVLPAQACSGPPRDLESKTRVHETTLALSSRFPNVLVVDLNGSICPAEGCRYFDDQMIYFRDADHISATFAVSQAALLSREVERAGTALFSPPNPP